MNPNLEKLMENWGDTLEAYGTARDFADNTKAWVVEPDESAISPNEPRFVMLFNPGYNIKGQLIAKQKQETAAVRNNLTLKQWENHGTDCFLCDNVGQAKDIGNNLTLPWNTNSRYVVLPNRYALTAPNFLIVAKEHDKKSKVGLSIDYLEFIVGFAERFGMDAYRNHEDCGMSQPGHEHLGLFPNQIRSTSGTIIRTSGVAASPLTLSKYGKDIFHVQNSRFATIAIRGRNEVERTAETTKRLYEQEDRFTLVYVSSNGNFPGTFYISPHKKARGWGAGPPAYTGPPSTEDITYNEMLDSVVETVFLKGEFNWNRIFE